LFTKENHTFALCAYKESAYLEDAVKSLINQTVKSKIIICTSTPNGLIDSIASKYDLPVYVNLGEKGIGGDWNFAYNTADTELVTIAHQDDIYEPDYVKEMLEFINRSKNPIMYFCGSFELRNGEKVLDNKLLKIKRLMLSPLKTKMFWNSKFIRRRILSFGCPICCPAVSMVKESFGVSPFTNDYLSDIDWQQWEIQSRKTGAFVYNPAPLMCHRIHEASTTSKIIGDNTRSKEDYDMYKKFWPSFIAKALMKFYQKGQDSNNV